MPDLAFPRMYLAACAQGTSVYAICGYGVDEATGKRTCFNTIECLKNASNFVNEIEDWEVI